MSDRFTDDRGTIQDILTESIDSVTEIYSREGAIRGNHVHKETTQWTYVVYGRLRAVSRGADGFIDDNVHGPGALLCDEPGDAHAWEALEGTLVMVFTKGPRSGANYESDTQRLAPEDKLL